MASSTPRGADLRRLVSQHGRSLESLEEQAGSFGFHTPPHITMEIENIEAQLRALSAQIAALERPAPEPGMAASLGLSRDPIAALLAGGDAALAYFMRRDLLDEEVGPVAALWELPEPQRLLRKQQVNGSWRYPGGNPESTPGSNYAVLETFRSLGILVEIYGFDRSHPSLAAAAEYLFSCRSAEGDIRGILGNQTMPYYFAAILELLIKAGYQDDARVTDGLEWLLTMRQADGGWIVAMQAVPFKARARDIWAGPTIPPDRTRPFSHMATGMVLRPFAAHPTYRSHPAALAAAALLKGRFFQADKYGDRQAPAYWLKFQVPFWWTNLLTGLDTLARMGFPADDPDVRRGLEWFVVNQAPDGLWEHGYGAGKRGQAARLRIALAVCRVFRRFQMNP